VWCGIGASAAGGRLRVLADNSFVIETQQHHGSTRALLVGGRAAIETGLAARQYHRGSASRAGGSEGGMVRRQIRFNSIVVPALLAVAAAAASLAADSAKPATGPSAEAQDLQDVQGRWEREEQQGSGAPYQRVTKEVKGNEEVVTYYRSDGTVWRSHRAQIKVARSGDAKVFTFSNVSIVEGDGKGGKFVGPSSYIYVVTDRQFKEVTGFLPGQEAQAPSVLVWRRAKANGAQVATVPAPDPRVQGIWEPYHSEEGGVDRKEPGDYFVTFERDRFVITRDGEVMLRGTFTTYAGDDPRRIDMRLEEDADNAENVGKTLQGIYAIDGTEMRWCTGTTLATEPPTSFITHEGEPYIFVLMRRPKKPA